MVNEVGEYHFLPREAFSLFTTHKLPTDTSEFLDLKSKGFVYNGYLVQTVDWLATKYRTKKQFLYDFTALHMFVVTRRCNQKCTYCHASSLDEDAGPKHDMDFTTAKKCVEIALKTPSPYVKFEFQGGEPLLNFEVVKKIVEYAEELNKKVQKNLEFVICTNLVALDGAVLDYLDSKNIMVSTSLDGPEDIHDGCRRLRRGSGSYETVIKHLNWTIERLGHGKVSALMTTTRENLPRLKEVIDEYIKRGLGSIFIRTMNPFGMAAKHWKSVGYTSDEFLKGYKDALTYLIDINTKGVHFPEAFATLLLTRILTPFSTGFVDLQSPSGAGIGGAIYDVNGDIYVSDEARMLAHSTGDKRFCIGNIHRNTWKESFCGGKLREIVAESCLEVLPGCSWCAFLPYCGVDPVWEYGTRKVGYETVGRNDSCHVHRSLFYFLFDYLRFGKEEVEDVFWSWVTARTFDQIRNNNAEEMAA